MVLCIEKSLERKYVSLEDEVTIEALRKKLEAYLLST